MRRRGWETQRPTMGDIEEAGDGGDAFDTGTGASAYGRSESICDRAGEREHHDATVGE